MPKSFRAGKKNLPKEKKKAEASGETNFAGNEDTVAKALSMAQQYKTFFEGQDAWSTYEDRVNKADQMMRLSASLPKQAENKTRDNVDVVPDIYMRLQRAVTASENDALFPGTGEFPAKYVADLSQIRDEMLMQAGEEIADQRNVLLHYSNRVDNRIAKIKKAWWGVNKYANGVVGMEWENSTVEVKERIPDNQGNYRLTTKKVKVQHPKMMEYDVADMLFDAMLDDIQKNQAVFLFGQILWPEIMSKGQTGDYINIDKVTDAQLYTGDDTRNQIRSDRQTNAGSSDDASRGTGEYQLTDVWLRAPINEKGEWKDGTDDSKDAAVSPTWHLVTFLGLLSKNPVCLRIIKNPYHETEIPYLLWHSHQDDKGAIHAGYPDFAEKAIDEYKTTLDQWFDNKNLNNAAPMIQEAGTLKTRDKDFGPRRLWEVKMGGLDKIKRFDVPSNTQDMLPFIQYLEERIKDIFSAEKTFLGEALGSRTSASEAQNAISQGQKPPIDKLRYMGEYQLLPWLLKWDERMWKRFAPKDLILTITRKNLQYEIKPAMLFGSMHYEIDGIDEFMNTILTQQASAQFMAGTGMQMLAEAPKAGRFYAYRELWKKRLGMDVQRIWPDNSETDSEHVAYSENEGFKVGTPDQPKAGENHDVHLPIHESLEALLVVMDQDEFTLEGGVPIGQTLQLLREHIAATKQLKSQDEGAAAAAQQQQAGPATPPVTEGEAAGDLIAGDLGGGV